MKKITKTLKIIQLLYRHFYIKNFKFDCRKKAIVFHNRIALNKI